MKNGILLIDKPANITSYDVVRKLKKIFKTPKIGHAGTLDPFATGLLIVAIGKGTRVLEYLSNKDKTYEFEMKLGIITDSFDVTGKVVQKNDCSHITEEDVLNVFNEFKGEMLQVPPIFSAKKMNGERLYEKARRGEIINIPPCKVTIYNIELLKYEECMARARVKVSKGTYIRSLVHDIGLRLKTGATTVNLRRLSIGNFDVRGSVEINSINESTSLMSLNEVLDFPKVIVKNDFTKNLYNGQSPKVFDIKDYDNFNKNDIVKILNEDGKFLAIGIAKRNSSFFDKMKFLHPEEGAVKIKKVFKDLQ